MSGYVFLDASPLGLLTQKPGKSTNADDCQQWLKDIALHGWKIYVPEITDYEVRRGLIESGNSASVLRLDQLIEQFNYVSITTAAMRLAADLWAQGRKTGRATADPKALDGDVILAAQAKTLTPAPAGLVIATANVAHISRYFPAMEWSAIKPKPLPVEEEEN